MRSALIRLFFLFALVCDVSAVKIRLAVLLLVASQVFAEVDCQLNLGLQVHFLDSTIWYDRYSFAYGSYTVVADTLSETLADGYRCAKERSYNEQAFLDSNVFFYRDLPPGVYPQSGEKILYIFTVSSATHGLGDVFKDEFLHWQQCGMLSLTYEEADSLIEPLVKMMNEEFVNEDCDCYRSDKLVVDDYPGEIPDQIVKWAKDACTKTSIVQPRKLACTDVFFENGLAHVPERLIGQRYFVFDLNGRVIQKGIAGETIRMPSTLAIFKIGNENPVLLKN